MKSFIKKQRVPFYLNALALVLMVAGMGFLIKSSVMSVTNRLGNLPWLIAALAAGMAAIVLGIWASNRANDKGYLSMASTMVAIAANVGVVGNALNARVMMIAGLYTYNRGYKEGWAVFNMSAVCFALLLIAALLLIVGAFFRPVKRAKAAAAAKHAETPETPAE